MRSFGRALTAKEVHALALSPTSDLRFFMRQKRTKRNASQGSILALLSRGADKDRFFGCTTTMTVVPAAALVHTAAAYGTETAATSTAVGATFPVTTTTDNVLSRHHGMSPPLSLSQSPRFWFRQTLLESNHGIVSTSSVQGRRFVFGRPPHGTGDSLCGSHVLVFCPVELAFHEAKVTRFHRKTGSYRIQYVRDGAEANISLDEHVVRRLPKSYRVAEAEDAVVVADNEDSADGTGGGGRLGSLGCGSRVPSSPQALPLTLKNLVLEGILRPGVNRLVATVKRSSPPEMPAMDGIVTWIADVHLDGTIRRAGIEYEGMGQFVAAMESQLGPKAAAAAAAAAAEVVGGSAPARDPWSVIRYRLPGGRSVSLARVRQVVVEVFGRYAFA